MLGDYSRLLNLFGLACIVAFVVLRAWEPRYRNYGHMLLTGALKGILAVAGPAAWLHVMISNELHSAPDNFIVAAVTHKATPTPLWQDSSEKAKEAGQERLCNATIRTNGTELRSSCPGGPNNPLVAILDGGTHVIVDKTEPSKPDCTSIKVPQKGNLLTGYVKTSEIAHGVPQTPTPDPAKFLTFRPNGTIKRRTLLKSWYDKSGMNLGYLEKGTVLVTIGEPAPGWTNIQAYIQKDGAVVDGCVKTSDIEMGYPPKG